ncbi:hypothetical protein [Streptomyces sp. NPDC002403]
MGGAELPAQRAPDHHQGERERGGRDQPVTARCGGPGVGDHDRHRRRLLRDSVGVDQYAGGHQVVDERGDLFADGLRVLTGGDGDLVGRPADAASRGDGMSDL